MIPGGPWCSEIPQSSYCFLEHLSLAKPEKSFEGKFSGESKRLTHRHTGRPWRRWREAGSNGEGDLGSPWYGGVLLSTSQQACCVLPYQFLHLSVNEGRGRGFLQEACRTRPQPAPLSLCGLTRNQGVYTTVREPAGCLGELRASHGCLK